MGANATDAADRRSLRHPAAAAKHIAATKASAGKVSAEITTKRFHVTVQVGNRGKIAEVYNAQGEKFDIILTGPGLVIASPLPNTKAPASAKYQKIRHSASGAEPCSPVKSHGHGVSAAKSLRSIVAPHQTRKPGGAVR